MTITDKEYIEHVLSKTRFLRLPKHIFIFPETIFKTTSGIYAKAYTKLNNDFIVIGATDDTAESLIHELVHHTGVRSEILTSVLGKIGSRIVNLRPYALKNVRYQECTNCANEKDIIQTLGIRSILSFSKEPIVVKHLVLVE